MMKSPEYLSEQAILALRYDIQRRVIGCDSRTYPSQTMYRYRILDRTKARPVRWCLTYSQAIKTVRQYEADDKVLAVKAAMIQIGRAVSAEIDRYKAALTAVGAALAAPPKKSDFTLAGDN